MGGFFFWVFEELFDEKVWHSNPSRRHKMVDDKIYKELLIGKTKNEIIELLGVPGDLVDTDKEVLSYEIGKPPSFSEHKREELIIVFENSIAIEAFRLRIE